MAFNKDFQSAKYLKDNLRDAAIEITYNDLETNERNLLEVQKEVDINTTITSLTSHRDDIQAQIDYYQAALDAPKILK